MPGVGSRWLVRAATGVAFLLVLPGLWVPRVHDDYIHAWHVASSRPLAQRLFGLYDFFTSSEVPGYRHAGLLPWWASDDLAVRFFRPLSSLDLAIDHLVLDGGALLSHLHAALWFGLLVLLAERVLRALLGPRRALVCTLLYACFSFHAMPLGFTAARHSLLSGVFAWAFLLGSVHALDDQRSLWRRLRPLSLSLALLAGESALAVLPLVAGLSLSRSDWRRGLRLLAPSLAVLLPYAAIYVAGGFGTRGSGGYLDPVGQSGELLAALPLRFLTLTGDWLGAIPGDFWLFGLQRFQAIFGLVALSLAGLSLWRLSHIAERKLVRRVWVLVASGLVSLVLLSPGIPGGRLLVIPALASAALFGTVAEQAVSHWQRGARLAPALLLTWVALFGVGLHPVWRIVFPLELRRAAELEVETVRRIGLLCQNRLALAVAVPDPIVSYLSATWLALDSARPKALHLLSMSPAAHTLSARDGQRFELEIDGDFLAFPWPRVWRGRPLQPGATVSLSGLTIDTLAAGSRPRIALKLEPGPEPCWLSLRDGKLEPFTPDRSGTTRLPPSTVF